MSRLAAGGLALALLALPGAAAPAVPSTVVAACVQPSGVYTQDIPWAQRLLDPTRVWSITTGRNVTVAMLGTGVDASNPQFGPGQVTAGADLLGTGRPTTTDCDGRGTFAAGIVAARANGSTTFVGVAPQAGILAIRYTQTSEQGATASDPNILAAAIRSATAAQAKVICVLVPSTTDSPALRDAVAAAAAADAVVVVPAATTEFSTQNGTAYPAPDEHVLAVAPIGPDGAPSSGVSGNYLDLAAPGKGLVSLAAGSAAKPGHIWPVDDPAFAAAYAAGVVALVRSHRPGLSATQVVSRIEMTASRGPSGGQDPRVGWGVVNPYAAISAEGIDATLTPEPARPGAVAAATAAPVSSARDALAATVAIVGLVLAAGAVIGLLVIRRGRSRRWRPGLRPPPPP